MRRNSIGNAFSLLGGAGIGAALMYLLDPETGAERRERLGRTAATTAHGAGHALGATWHGLGETAHRASEAFQSAGHNLYERGRDLGESIGSSSSSARKSLRSSVRGLPSFAEAMPSMPSIFHRRRQERYHKHDLMTDTLLVAGALAVGAGMMMLLDPQQGRRRRALIRDKVVRGMNEAGNLARTTGRYIADHSRGVAAETRARFSHEEVTDAQLEARVRSEIGRAVSNVGALEVTARNGLVTLTGPILASEIDTLMCAVRDVRGVRDVDNQLRVREQPGGEPGLQGAPYAQQSGGL
jgi:hypothetical protein